MAKKNTVEQTVSNASVDTKDASNQKLVNVESSQTTGRNESLSNKTNVKPSGNGFKVDGDAVSGALEAQAQSTERLMASARDKYLGLLGVKPEVKVEEKVEEGDVADKEVDAVSESLETEDTSLKVEQEDDASKDAEPKPDESKSDEEKQESEAEKLAKELDIPLEVQKEFAIQKLLKRVDTVTSQKKAAEARALKAEEMSKSPAAKEDISIWTPEYADSKRKEYDSLLSGFTEALGKEVTVDDDGRELGIELDGRYYSRKQISSAIKNVTQEMSRVDDLVKTNKHFQELDARAEAKTYSEVPWYGDESNALYTEAAQVWNEAVTRGVQNVAGLKYIFALGFDEANKRINAQQEKAKPTGKIEIKKPEPKPTTPKTVSAPTPRVQQTKVDEVERLREKFKQSGSPEDQKALKVAEYKKRLGL